MLVIQLKHPHAYIDTTYIQRSYKHKSGVYFTLKCHLERIGRVSIQLLYGSNGKKKKIIPTTLAFFNNILVIYTTVQKYLYTQDTQYNSNKGRKHFATF